MVQRLHDICFTHGVLYLIIVNKVRLLHDFESKDLTSVFFLALENASEGAFADDLNDVEI